MPSGGCPSDFKQRANAADRSCATCWPFITASGRPRAPSSSADAADGACAGGGADCFIAAQWLKMRCDANDSETCGITTTHGCVLVEPHSVAHPPRRQPPGAAGEQSQSRAAGGLPVRPGGGTCVLPGRGAASGCAAACWACAEVRDRGVVMHGGVRNHGVVVGCAIAVEVGVGSVGVVVTVGGGDGDPAHLWSKIC